MLTVVRLHFYKVSLTVFLYPDTPLAVCERSQVRTLDENMFINF